MSNREKAAHIVRDAGGRIVGRTKLQKVAYMLELVNLGDGFPFEYRHYGPYSEELSDAIRAADVFGLVSETEQVANWGGLYSIFNALESAGEKAKGLRSEFAEKLAGIDSIELELAATAAFLSAEEGQVDPWGETARRKPEKANDGRLEKAKRAYQELLVFDTPKKLPQIV